MLFLTKLKPLNKKIKLKNSDFSICKETYIYNTQLDYYKEKKIEDEQNFYLQEYYPPLD